MQRAKENLNGKYEIKNPYSGNFRQLFIPFFCQLVLDFKQLLHTLREWIKQNKWVRVNWVLQLLVRFSKVTRVPFISIQSNFRTKVQMIQLNFSSLKCCLTFLGKISVTRFTETLFLYFEFRPMLKSMQLHGWSILCYLDMKSWN